MAIVVMDKMIAKSGSLALISKLYLDEKCTQKG